MTLSGRPAALVGALLLLALVVRVGVVLATPDADPVNDAADYVQHAESIAAGDGFPESGIAPGDRPSAYRPPVYPYLLGAVFAVTGDSVTAGRLAQAVVGTVAVGLLALVALQLFGPVAAVVAAGVAAVYPPLAIGGSALLSEPLFVALELGALAAVLRFRGDPRRRWLVMAGALAGLAILTRSNGAVLLLPLALLVWRRPWRSWRAAAAPALLLACAALAVAPWTIRNAIVFDELVPVTTQTGLTLAGTYNDTTRTDPRFPGAWRPPNLDPEYAALIERTRADGEPAVNDALGDAAREYALDRPGYVIEVAWLNLLRVFGLGGKDYNDQASAEELSLGPRWSDAMTYGFFPFALLAAAGCLTAAARRAPAWIWAMPLLMVATSIVASATQRFRLPADPFIALLAALALAAALARRRARQAPLPARARPASPARSGPS